MPKNEKPIINVEVWRFSLRVNLRNPSDEFYYWILSLHKYSQKSKNIFEDKRIKSLINYLWNYYCYVKIVYLIFSTIPLLILYAEGFIILDVGKNQSLKPIKDVFTSTILVFIVLLFIYEILLMRISGVYCYLTKLSSYTKLITIFIYLFANSLLLYRDDPQHNCLNVYALNILVGTLWFAMNLQITTIFSRLCYKLVAMTKAIGSLTILVVIWLCCFSHIFYFTNFALFRKDNQDIKNSYE